MMSLLKIYLFFIIILFFVSSTSAQYTITRGVFGNGRGNLSGDNQNVRGTVGQTLIGKTENTTFQSRIGFWYFGDLYVSIGDPMNSQIPQKYELYQNYPNPFNPMTTIQFALPEAGWVKLEVFDIAGKKIVTLINAAKPAGMHCIVFDGSGLSTGIYIYRLDYAGNVFYRKMMLIK